MSKVVISSCLEVDSEFFYKELRNIKDTLTFFNPFEPEIAFLGYEETESTVKLPRASIEDLPKVFTEIEDATVSSTSSFTVKPSFKLKDYQEKAESDILEFIANTNDPSKVNILLTAATGSGKTYMLSSVLSKLKQKVLFLSHLSMLSEQVAAEISNNTTASTLILSKNAKEFADINIATFQLLHINPELLERIANEVSVVVIDETENIASSSRLAVLFKLKTKVNIFVSATPTRELVKRTGVIENLVTHKVSMESAGIPLMYVMIDYRDKVWSAPIDKLQYRGSLYAFLRDSKILNDVVTLTSHLVQYEGTIWIIASLDKIHRMLQKQFDDLGIPSKSIQGLTSKKDRAAVIEGVESGAIKVLISSAPISAGISIPQIAAGIRLEPHSSSDELLEQQEGRLKRLCKFKDYQVPLWFDLAISGSLEFKGKQRFRKYNSSPLGCKILKKEDIPSFIKLQWSTKK